MTRGSWARPCTPTPTGPATSAPTGARRRIPDPAGPRSADDVTAGSQRVLDRADPQLAEVEHGRGQHRVGAGVHGGAEVGGAARTTAGNYRDVHRCPDRPDELGVE